MPFIRYAEATQADFPAAGRDVAILPLAAMETHGPHLPLGTDGLIADGILDRAAELGVGGKGSVWRLPTLWLGASAEHGDRAATLSLEAEPLIAQIVAVGEGLASAGLRRIVLFNAHGGNGPAAAVAALRLRTRLGMLAANVHWLDFGLPDGLVPPAPVAGDIHGGWIETSAILHLAPHLVRAERAGPAPAQPPASMLYPGGPVAWGWKTGDLADGGWVGHPELARAGLGKALIDHAAGRLLTLIDEVAAATWPAAS